MASEAGGGEEMEQADENISPTDFLTINVIYQMRIYDMLTVIARNLNKDEADALVEEHSRGRVVGPPPVYIPDEEA